MTNEEHQKRREILQGLKVKIANIQAGGRSAISDEDQARLDWLRRLDGADIEVSDWEAGFINGFLTNARPMTPAQRATVDAMMEDYPGVG